MMNVIGQIIIEQFNFDLAHEFLLSFFYIIVGPTHLIELKGSVQCSASSLKNNTKEPTIKEALNCQNLLHLLNVNKWETPI